jgi:hypothetical protein
VTRVRLIALGAAALLAGAARADPAPSPPPASSHGRLVPGQTVQLERSPPDLRVVPPAGALYLEEPAFSFLVERQRRCEVERDVAVKVAEERGIRGAVIGIVTGVAIGAVVGALAAR